MQHCGLCFNKTFKIASLQMVFVTSGVPSFVGLSTCSISVAKVLWDTVLQQSGDMAKPSDWLTFYVL